MTYTALFQLKYTEPGQVDAMPHTGETLGLILEKQAEAAVKRHADGGSIVQRRMAAELFSLAADAYWLASTKVLGNKKSDRLAEKASKMAARAGRIFPDSHG